MKIIRNLIPCLFSLLIIGSTPIARGAGPNDEIRNEFLQVTWMGVEGGFSARALPSGTVFAVLRETRTAGATITKIDVTDRTFGKGNALQVIESDGSRDVLTLFPLLPFILLRSTLHNPKNEVKVVRSIRPVSVDVHLDRPAAELRTLGTGGLLTADQNPGSYAWLAVADPRTRRGVVGGWLTHDRGGGVVQSRIEAGRVVLDPQIDYGRLRVAARGDTMLETFALGHFDECRSNGSGYRVATPMSASTIIPRNQCVFLSRRCNTRLGAASDLWFWSVCSNNALYSCAQGLSWTEQVPKPCCAPAELEYRLINKRSYTSGNSRLVASSSTAIPSLRASL